MIWWGPKSAGRGSLRDAAIRASCDKSFDLPSGVTLAALDAYVATSAA
jgi:hypothetical protein